MKIVLNRERMTKTTKRRKTARRFNWCAALLFAILNLIIIGELPDLIIIIATPAQVIPGLIITTILTFVLAGYAFKYEEKS